MQRRSAGADVLGYCKYISNLGGRRINLFHRCQPELRIAKRDLATGVLQNVFHSEKRLTAPEALSIHGSTLYLMLSLVADPSRSNLVAVDIPSGRARTLKSFDSATRGMDSGCTVSSDGRTMLVTPVRREQGDIYLPKLARQ